jgi:hypothetical protein
MSVSVHRIFEGAILKADAVLCDRVEIIGARSRRGGGDGVIWRGTFSLPDRRPDVGETLHIRLADNSLIALVVTDVAGDTVHFRARGKMPERT